jgi:cytoskeletal protein CcmA (bactofilin family)
MNKYKKLPKNLENQRKAYQIISVNSNLDSSEESKNSIAIEHGKEQSNSTLRRFIPFFGGKANIAIDSEVVDRVDLMDTVVQVENSGISELKTENRDAKNKKAWDLPAKKKLSKKEDNSIQKEQKEETSMNANGDGVTKEVAVISNTMLVNGDIELESSLIVNGKITGNINCKDVIEATYGSVIDGNIFARSVKCNGSELKGNITVEDQFEANNQTKVFGNINAKRVEISGSVEGEVQASESIILKKTAVVKGDIYSASISIEAGAQLDGKVVTMNMQKNAVASN